MKNGETQERLLEGSARPACSQLEAVKIYRCTSKSKASHSAALTASKSPFTHRTAPAPPMRRAAAATRLSKNTEESDVRKIVLLYIRFVHSLTSFQCQDHWPRYRVSDAQTTTQVFKRVTEGARVAIMFGRAFASESMSTHSAMMQ